MKKLFYLILISVMVYNVSYAQSSDCHRQLNGTRFEQENNQLDTVTYAFIAFEKADQVIHVSEKLSQVKTLDFVACNADSILSEMSYLPSVNFISMNRVELYTWPKSINRYNKISCLDLAGNNLTHLPSDVLNFNNLQYLSMGDGAYGGNKLTVLDETICKLTSLKFLCFYQNPIDSISPDIVNLKNLETLNLNQTKIKYLPVELGQLKNLRELQLSSTDIKTIPEELLQCSKLNEIGFNNSQSLDFSQAFDVLANLPSLTNLNLSLNSISGLADKIVKLKNLETLDITNTDLTFVEVKTILDGCKKLKEVDAIIKGLTPNQKEYLEKKYKHIEFRFKWF